MRRRRRRPIPQTVDIIVNPPGSTTISTTVLATSKLVPGWVHTQTDPTGGLTTSEYTALANAAPAQAQHLQGFGTGTLWATQAGSKSWGGMDRLFGTPGNPASGYMKDATIRVLYALNCPAWMRVPVSGAWNDPVPQGSTTNEFDYKPPHHSHYGDFAQLLADVVTRYPQITHVVIWNEFKGFWAGGIPADYGGGNGRWWYDNNGPTVGTTTYTGGYTNMYNQCYNAIKAVNPAVKVGGPYMVFNTQSWEFPNDWADDAETDPLNRLQGHAPNMWGYADKKVLYAVRYFLKNCVGCDFFAMDLRNSAKDYAASSQETGSYTAAKWNSNPEGGAHPYYYSTDPWTVWQKEADIMSWFRNLGAASPALYGRSVADSRTLPFWMMEWYPNAKVNEVINKPETTTPYPDAVSSDAEKNSVAAEGLRRAAIAGYEGILHWSPHGDSAGHSNPISLWNSAGVATGLMAIDQAFVDHFGAGVQLLTPQNVPAGMTILASATHLLLISKVSTSITATIDGVSQTLTPFQVKLVTR